MPLPSFHEWLRSAQEAPEADRLATVIAQAGAAGISRGRLEKVSWGA
jgi:Tfp pilus assembly protein FimT